MGQTRFLSGVRGIQNQVLALGGVKEGQFSESRTDAVQKYRAGSGEKGGN